MNFEAVKPIQNVSIEQMLLFIFCFLIVLLAEKFHFFISLHFESCVYLKKKKKKFFFFFLHIHQKCVLISIVSDNNV